METIYINEPSAPFGEHSAAIALNGWDVVNAPRPIPGMVTWAGEFRRGIFYAAGPAAQFGNAWRDLDAWPVQAITNVQVVELVKAMCDERDITLAEVLDIYDGDWSALAKACGFPWKEVRQELWSTPNAPGESDEDRYAQEQIRDERP